MNTIYLIKVRRLYPNSRHNQKQWIKSVRNLGDRWLVGHAQDKQKLREQALVRCV
jgi:hypothetical protein